MRKAQHGKDVRVSVPYNDSGATQYGSGEDGVNYDEKTYVFLLNNKNKLFFDNLLLILLICSCYNLNCRFALILTQIGFRRGAGDGDL